MMPRSKVPAVYGPEYEQLLLTAFANSFDTTYKLALPDPALSRALSKKTYAYWNALRTENTRPDLIELCNKLSIRIVGEEMWFFRRTDSWDAVAIRNAMGLEKGFADLGLTRPALNTGTSQATGKDSGYFQKLRAVRERQDILKQKEADASRLERLLKSTANDGLLGTATRKKP